MKRIVGTIKVDGKLTYVIEDKNNFFDKPLSESSKKFFSFCGDFNEDHLFEAELNKEEIELLLVLKHIRENELLPGNLLGQLEDKIENFVTHLLKQNL